MSEFVKKTIELDEALIRKVRRHFDVKTDKEAVNRALKLVADEADIIAAHEDLAGRIDLRTPFS